jgi:nucleotide-binding universal stress UspA family protein
VSPEVETYWKEIRDEVEAELEEAAAMVRANGVPVATVCTGEHPVDLLLNVAHEVGASWIVVGAKGVGTVHRMVMGSTTMKLLHHSDIPVVVVPG